MKDTLYPAGLVFHPNRDSNLPEHHRALTHLLQHLIANDRMASSCYLLPSTHLVRNLDNPPL